MKRVVLASLMSLCLVGSAFAQTAAELDAAKRYVRALTIVMHSDSKPEVRTMNPTDPQLDDILKNTVLKPDSQMYQSTMQQFAVWAKVDPKKAPCVQTAMENFNSGSHIVTVMARFLLTVKPAAFWTKATRSLMGIVRNNGNIEVALQQLVPATYPTFAEAESALSFALDQFQPATLAVTNDMKATLNKCDTSIVQEQAQTLSVGPCTGGYVVTGVFPPVAGSGSNQWTVTYNSNTGSGRWLVSPGMREKGGCRLTWGN